MTAELSIPEEVRFKVRGQKMSGGSNADKVAR